jgi:glycosyltransferase involved in cell wall biosynthesis
LTYLPEALASAIAQTYPDVEIIVSDNCSTDETEQVVRAVADPRVKYLRHREDIGANANFNACLREATGDYFLLLHDDDLVDRDFVALCLDAAGDGSETGVIRTGTRIIGAGGDVLREVPNRVAGRSVEGFIRGWFAGETTLYMCSTLFNTRWLRDTGGFNSPRMVFQDAFAIMPLAARHGRVDVEAVKASFRRHALGRTRATTVDDWCADSLALLELVCDLVPGPRDVLRAEGLRFFARLNYGRAAEADSTIRRLVGYGTVFRKFRYRQAPQRVDLYRLIQGTSLQSAARFAKRKLKEQASVG